MPICAPTFDTAKGDAVHASSPGRNYMEALGPAGGWVTTPLDIAKLAAALRDPSLAVCSTRPTVDAMRVPVTVPVEVPPPVNGWSYGLGLILFGDGSWGHTGTIESTHAIVINRPDGLTVSVLVSGKIPSNTDHLQQVIDLAVAAAIGVGPATTFDAWQLPNEGMSPETIFAHLDDLKRARRALARGAGVLAGVLRAAPTCWRSPRRRTGGTRRENALNTDAFPRPANHPVRGRRDRRWLVGGRRRGCRLHDAAAAPRAS